jgi:disulfide bond formation protein DsbB
MSTPQFSVFFATLSLACWAGTVAVVVLTVLGRRSPGPAVVDAIEGVRGTALWLAWVVAATATAGSLYYSQVAHFVPCELCWFQRVCMYPLTAILLVAAIRDDRGVWRYALPQVVIGTAVAAYHSQLQAFPKQATFCSTVNPCTVRYVWELGFVSLPFMALAAFGFIVAMLLVAATTPTLQPEPAEAETPVDRAVRSASVRLKA